ncbi:hypothetical protein KSP40_PGU003090 [Platanthera guangdongensis]|uniref:Uncharacterized protein n=1 Tax=Platanthera guangdongensis TaxID=2320717 RepID=A0ABR2MXJ0_9ASPA
MLAKATRPGEERRAAGEEIKGGGDESEASYEVFREGGGTGRLFFSGVSPNKNMEVHLIETRAGNKIVTAFWRHPFVRFTLLYSHGNAADLGHMLELFIELRAHLRVNIMWRQWERRSCSILLNREKDKRERESSGYHPF